MIASRLAEGLVHEQDRRLERERAGDRDALLHPAGELVRVAVRCAAEVGELEELARRFAASLAAVPVHPQRVRDVVEHRAPREELVELLEDDGAVGPRRRATCRPATSIVPPTTGRKPAIAFSSVDFPQPDGPIRTNRSRGHTSRSIRSIATWKPAAVS